MAEIRPNQTIGNRAAAMFTIASRGGVLFISVIHTVFFRVFILTPEQWQRGLAASALASSDPGWVMFSRWTCALLVTDLEPS